MRHRVKGVSAQRQNGREKTHVVLPEREYRDEVRANASVNIINARAGTQSGFIGLYPSRIASLMNPILENISTGLLPHTKLRWI